MTCGVVAASHAADVASSLDRLRRHAHNTHSHNDALPAESKCVPTTVMPHRRFTLDIGCVIYIYEPPINHLRSWVHPPITGKSYPLVTSLHRDRIKLLVNPNPFVTHCTVMLLAFPTFTDPDMSVDTPTLTLKPKPPTPPYINSNNNSTSHMVVNQEGDVADSMEGIQSTDVHAGDQHVLSDNAQFSTAQQDVQRTLHKKKSSYDLRDDFQSSAMSGRSLEGV